MINEVIMNENNQQKSKFDRIVPIYCNHGEELLNMRMLKGLEKQKIGVVRVHFRKPDEKQNYAKINNFYIEPLSPNMTIDDIMEHAAKVQSFEQRINNREKYGKAAKSSNNRER